MRPMVVSSAADCHVRRPGRLLSALLTSALGFLSLRGALSHLFVQGYWQGHSPSVAAGTRVRTCKTPRSADAGSSPDASEDSSRQHWNSAFGRRQLLAAGLGPLVTGAALSSHEASAAAAAAVGAAREVFSGTIRKSPNDRREYRAVTLANGLRVLLVSDAEATSAAAALSVHAGFYQDPADLPGLAHFCEHMLFLGTKEYPKEDSFRQFLGANGGSSNAFTREQDTTYFFDVSPNALQASLKRFGSFFSSPLFTASGTDRELSAIESEDSKNRQSDAFRLNQLGKSFAAEGHPQGNYGTGNRQTLLVEPKRRGTDIRAALLDYFGKYYDAGLMALCIVGKESAAELEAFAEQSFGAVPGRGGVASPMLAYRGVNPYPALKAPSGEAAWIDAVPVADRRAISIAWPIVFQDESARRDWVRCKPQVTAAYLLGHEGENSLLSILRRRGWATNILVGTVREDDNFAMLRCSFEVTDEGLRQRDAIVEATYAVLRRLDRGGVPRYIFEENRDMAQVRFRYQSKTPATSSVLGAVDNIQKGYGPADYVSGQALFLDPVDGVNNDTGVLAKLSASILNQLTPERATVSAVSKSFDAGSMQAERWYGTRYRLSTVSSEVFGRWRNPPELEGWSVPPPNPFIPTDFDLRSSAAAESDRLETLAVPPELIQDDERWQIFYKPDKVFQVPKAVVFIFLWMPEATVDEDAIPSRIWLLSLLDRLTESFYAAGYAGFNFDVSITVEGVSIEFGGFSSKMVLLVEKLLARIADFEGPSEDEFQRAIDKIRRDQSSFDTQAPFQYAAYSARIATHTPDYSIEFLRKQASGVTIGQARAFGEKFRSKTQQFFGQALIQGNLGTMEAGKIRSLLNSMPFQSMPRDKLTRVKLAKLPVGKDALLVKPHPNPAEVNNAVWVAYFTSPEPRVALMTQLVQILLADPFFTSLRTEQQLGYIVISQADREAGLVGRLGLAVQSSTTAPEGLVQAVDKFMLERFRKVLAALTAEELKSYKETFVEKIVKRDERLGEEVTRWWQEINLLQFNWRRRAEDAEMVKSISKEDLLGFYDRYLSPSGAERRRIVSATFANSPGRGAAMAAMQSQAESQGAVIVKDATIFSSESPKWPLLDRRPTDSL
ncbi:unnamed protein product [Polarella glacialis]|uniref:Insulysin n=2 Tax=Polarella glacialis TaxID=89957 RepID=A0A813FVW1_POLGL|nr:unnamed protein product [Polarella glacialis]